MAAWTMQQHLINAALWASIGYFATSSSYLDMIPIPAKLAGLAVVYSYATDYIAPMLHMG